MNGPVFVKIEDYKSVNEILAQINKKINDSKQVLDEIDKMKKEEEIFMDKWKQALDELEKRASNINGMLYNVKY
jgi:tetrahydromethanopterin S-methyltransferase subunit G